MNAINLNAIAIPMFIGSIILEVVISNVKNVKLYNWKDFLANISIGITGLLVGISTRGIALTCYYFAYTYQLFAIENVFIYWIALFFLNDIIFYEYPFNHLIP